MRLTSDDLDLGADRALQRIARAEGACLHHPHIDGVPGSTRALAAGPKR